MSTRQPVMLIVNPLHFARDSPNVPSTPTNAIIPAKKGIIKVLLPKDDNAISKVTDVARAVRLPMPRPHSALPAIFSTFTGQVEIHLKLSLSWLAGFFLDQDRSQVKFTLIVAETLKNCTLK